MATRTRSSYALVLATAVLCYAALGAVLRLLPPYVQGELGSGPLALGLSVGAPAMTAVLTRPLGGRAADRRGPYAVVVTGAVIMALATVPLVGVSSLPALLLSRLGTGAGEGLMMSAAVLWLLRLAGPERRGRALGHIGLANYAGLTVGPLLADAFGTRNPAAIFAVAAALPLIAALVARMPERVAAAEGEQQRLGEVLRVTARAGVGLMLVNFGYVALLSFGTDVAKGNGGALVVPAFAAVVIVTRTVAASVPDRLGATRTLLPAALAEAAGLAAITAASSAPLVLTAVVVLAAGQALAVPALGLLALARVPTAQQGAAAGAFFAWFDGGVAVGGVVAGGAAHLTSPSGALLAAAVCVAVVPVAAKS